MIGKQPRLLLTGSLLIGFLLACEAKAVPAISETPTISPSQMFTQTSTPEPTLILSPTVNPMLTQGLAFAAPILSEIAARPPDYEDDFSNPNSGWNVGPISLQSEGWGSGETGYLEGEFYLKTPPASIDETAIPALPFMSDLVVEMDVRFAEVESGDFQVHFRHWDDNWSGLGTGQWHGYSMNLMSSEQLRVAHLNQDGAFNLTPDLPIRECLSSCHLQIIAKGPELAAFIDNVLIYYHFDTEYAQYMGKGRFNLVSHNFSGTVTQRIHIDNFRLWDLSP